MPQVTIVKGFNLTHDDTGQEEYIPVGVHDFPAAMASHWYVKAHSDKPDPVIPKPGTPEYAGFHIAAARRRAIVQASIEQEAEDAANKVRTDAVMSNRFSEAEEQAHTEEMNQANETADAAEEGAAVRDRRRPALPMRRMPDAIATPLPTRNVLPPQGMPPPPVKPPV